MQYYNNEFKKDKLAFRKREKAHGWVSQEVKVVKEDSQ